MTHNFKPNEELMKALQVVKHYVGDFAILCEDIELNDWLVLFTNYGWYSGIDEDVIKELKKWMDLNKQEDEDVSEEVHD